MGSDALAAVNVAAPVFLICTGISLMFGSGVSVVAAIHLSRNNPKAANINVTQAFTCAFLFMSIVSVVLMSCPEAVARLFGSSPRLLPFARDYIMGVTPGLPALLLMTIGFFVIRLDGSPKVAMVMQMVASGLNIVLDWIFVFPLIFMFGNAIAQSALPIVSYNHGAGQNERVRQTLRLSIKGAVLCGLLISAVVAACAPWIVSMFLDRSEAAWRLASDGLPLFATGITFFTLNIVLIGYEQSIERARPAIFHMLLRGAVLLVPVFILLPAVVGNVGLWLAVPLSELLTLIVIILYMRKR